MSSTINSSAPVAGANTGQVEQEAMPPVTVSMKKLTAGVTTMFAGIVQMLEALEPQMAQRLADIAIQGDTNSADIDAHHESTDGGKEGENVETETADSGVPDSAVPDDGVPDDGAADSIFLQHKTRDFLYPLNKHSRFIFQQSKIALLPHARRNVSFLRGITQRIVEKIIDHLAQQHGVPQDPHLAGRL